MKRAGATLSAVLVLAGLQVAGPAASAADARACVAKAEFNSVRYAETRETLERRWEVAGKGRPVAVPGIGRATAYKRCGEPLSEAFYAVQYVPEDGRLYGYTLVAWHAPREDDTPADSVPADDPCEACTVVTP